MRLALSSCDDPKEPFISASYEDERAGTSDAQDSSECGMSPPFTTEASMLYYAVVFFVIAIIAAVLGFGGIAFGAAEIAKVLFFVFLVLFIGSLIMGLVNRRNL